MGIILDLNAQLAHYISAYLNNITLAIIATCLVVYGNNLNNLIKSMVSSWVFVIRILAFILMCSFGYGLLAIWLQPILLTLLKYIPFPYLPISVMTIFCVLGVLAEKKKQL